MQKAGSEAPAARVELLERALEFWREPAFGELADEEAVGGAAVRREWLGPLIRS